MRKFFEIIPLYSVRVLYNLRNKVLIKFVQGKNPIKNVLS